MHVIVLYTCATEAFSWRTPHIQAQIQADPSYLLCAPLLFPLHLVPSPVHSTGFSFCFSPGFLAIFISSSNNNAWLHHYLRLIFGFILEQNIRIWFFATFEVSSRNVAWLPLSLSTTDFVCAVSCLNRKFQPLDAWGTLTTELVSVGPKMSLKSAYKGPEKGCKL